MVGMVLIDSEESLRASAEAASKLREMGAQQSGLTFDVFEGEVVAQI